METYDPTAWSHFLTLLERQPGRSIDYDDFRMEVEEIYNYKLDHKSITSEELSIIKRLFDVVTRYSPFRHDREKYPTIYCNERAVDDALDSSRSALGIERRS